MQIIIKGKQTEVTPRLRQYIEHKVQRLSRFVDAESRVEVTITEEQTRSAKDRYSVQLTLSPSAHPIHSAVSAVNASMAFDLVLDKIVAQLGHNKDRQVSKQRHQALAVKVLSLSRTGSLAPLENGQDGNQEDEQLISSVEEQNEEIWSQVLEIRRMPTRPMNDREAIAEMEKLGLPFYPFFNEAANSVNVIYRLEKETGYGLLVPALD